MARKRKEALVENNPNLVKNLDTGAVINTNTSELLARREQIGKLQEKDAEIQSYRAHHAKGCHGTCLLLK